MLHDEDDPLSGSFFDVPNTTSSFFDSPNVTRSPLTTSFYASHPEQSTSQFTHDHSNRFERPEITDSSRTDRPTITVASMV
ncbi:hypothetical protein BJV82DRAFT_366255 [Fennellomyces sp. T-0311]|nr:hypothetical protein BJV82DRAFT_366255 [Fennellomyces sp. T-0311]